MGKGTETSPPSRLRLPDTASTRAALTGQRLDPLRRQRGELEAVFAVDLLPLSVNGEGAGG
jgi:hypothetical protein